MTELTQDASRQDGLAKQSRMHGIVYQLLVYDTVLSDGAEVGGALDEQTRFRMTRRRLTLDLFQQRWTTDRHTIIIASRDVMVVGVGVTLDAFQRAREPEMRLGKRGMTL